MAAIMSCSSCGHHLSNITSDESASEAQLRIEDLQTQVRLLNEKAVAAIDKLADYEDEIRSLRFQCAELQKEKDTNMPVAPQDSRDPPVVSLPQDRVVVNHNKHLEDDSQNRNSLSRLSNIGSLWSNRRNKRGSLPENTIPAVTHLSVGLGVNVAGNLSTPNLTTPVQEYLRQPSPPPFATDPGPKAQSLTLVGLQTSLETEREMRLRAESNLMQTQSELEELTVQLFGQANEMVAAERKARAKLEERVKLLETRDKEKRKRLERLEKAMERIERVRKIVGEHENMLEREKENLEDVIEWRGSQRERDTTPLRQSQSRVRLKRKESMWSGKRGAAGGIDEEETFEFDVRLKVWRRSQANMWMSPTLD